MENSQSSPEHPSRSAIAKAAVTTAGWPRMGQSERVDIVHLEDMPKGAIDEGHVLRRDLIGTASDASLGFVALNEHVIDCKLQPRLP